MASSSNLSDLSDDVFHQADSSSDDEADLMASSFRLSDDDFYQDGCRSLTKEEEMEYYRVLKETEGFDVPDFGNIFAFSLIIPINLQDAPSLLKEVQISANEAIKYYNKENGTNFEVVNIVKANSEVVCGIMYYITFNVKPIGTSAKFPTITFQARVWYGIPIGNIKIELCRPKPSN